MNSLTNKPLSTMAEYMMTIRQVFNTLITSILCFAFLFIVSPNYAEEQCFKEQYRWGRYLERFSPFETIDGQNEKLSVFYICT